MMASKSADPSSDVRNPSAWASLSIRERIQAMNKTLDIVEEKQRSTTPNSGLLLRFSTSEETFPSSSTDPRADEHNRTSSSNSRIQTSALSSSNSVTSRSSVVDIWRSRETVSPQVDSRKKVGLDDVSRSRRPNLPVSSKNRHSDEEEKKSTSSSSADAPLSMKIQGQNSVTGGITAVPNSNPTPIPYTPPSAPYERPQPADFTIVPATTESHSPASTDNKRTRLTALWERTGAGNTVAGAKQRLGIVDSSPLGSSGVTGGIPSSSSRAPLSTTQSNSTDPWPVSRTGTTSPADTTFSTGTADTKRSSVTDIWELRCRMSASEPVKDQSGSRPSSVPPTASSQESKRLSRASLHLAESKARGDDAKVAPDAARGLPFPPRPLGEAALGSIKHRSGVLRATRDHDEATPRLGVSQESRDSSMDHTPVATHGSKLKSWRPKTTDLPLDRSIPRTSEKKVQNLSLRGESNQSPRTKGLHLSSSRVTSSTNAIAANQFPIRTGADNETNAASRSVAGRWKYAAGSTRQNGNATEGDELDEKLTTGSSGLGRDKTVGRWNNRTKELSAKTQTANKPFETTSIATVDPSRSRSHLIPVLAEKQSSSRLVASRWNEIATTAVCQGNDSVSQSPQGSMTEEQKPTTISPARDNKGDSEIDTFSERLGNLCPATNTSTADDDSEGGKRKHSQASPTFRSNYRKVADHWLKVTSDAKVLDVTKKKSPLHHRPPHTTAETSERRIGVNETYSHRDVSSSTNLPSPRVPKSLKRYTGRFLAAAGQCEQRDTSKSTGNAGHSSRELDGVPRQQLDLRQQPATQQPNKQKPNFVKTVTVSSPDAVEVIQRGDFGGEISRCVLADALSNDSAAPVEDEKGASSAQIASDGQVQGAASEEADSDESKQKPSKIIKSWNVRVYQTEQLPSSPRFSRQYTKVDLLPTEESRGSLDCSKALPAVVKTSNSSAFNTWNASPTQDNVLNRSSDKSEPRVSTGKHKRDLVSLGRRHIVQGLVSKPYQESRNLDMDVSFDVAQSTSSDDSVSLVLGSPSRNISSVEESAVAVLKPSVISTHHDPVPIPSVASQTTNDIVVSSPHGSPTRRKVVPPRKHLPSPIIRRKKIVRERALAPAVANNLSDIVEGRSEDSHTSGPRSPRTKELNSKKRELLAQRRKLKLGMKDGAVTDSSQYSTAEEDSDSLPPGGRLAPNAHQEPRRATIANGTGKYEKARAGLRLPVASFNGKRADPSIPRSPVSDVDFSFLTDANSVNSGMTSILSAGSLSNRAEKLLAGRKRELRKATGHVLPLTEHRQPSPSVSVADRTIERPESSTCQKPQIAQSVDGGGSATTERPRLETRYNTSSRFLDAAQMATHRNREVQHEARIEHHGLADQVTTVESTESSYQSADSASDESDARRPKRHSRTRRSRKAPKKPLVQQPSVASEQFLAENAANFTAFSTAYRRFSLRDIANDLAGEIKLLGIDTSSFASTVNSKIALCVNETKRAKSCHEYLGFGDEDVAIEVEFMEEELDEDASNSIEDDDDDDSTLEEPANILPGNRSMCAPLGYQGQRVS